MGVMSFDETFNNYVRCKYLRFKKEKDVQPFQCLSTHPLFWTYWSKTKYHLISSLFSTSSEATVDRINVFFLKMAISSFATQLFAKHSYVTEMGYVWEQDFASFGYNELSFAVTSPAISLYLLFCHVTCHFFFTSHGFFSLPIISRGIRLIWWEKLSCLQKLYFFNNDREILSTPTENMVGNTFYPEN